MPDMQMQLTRIIPAKKVTAIAKWVHKHFHKLTPDFRRSRAEGGEVVIRCFWCDTEFENGDSLALAAFDCGNRLLCVECAEEFLRSVQPGFVPRAAPAIQGSGVISVVVPRVCHCNGEGTAKEMSLCVVTEMEDEDGRFTGNMFITVPVSERVPLGDRPDLMGKRFNWQIS